MGTERTLTELNDLDVQAFAAALAHVFEHAPWVVERTAARRPFATRDALHRAMMETVHRASPEEQRALIAGHPELGVKAADHLTDASAREQGDAGLDRLTAGELSQFRALNAAYRARFDFPFVMAVKGKDKHTILTALEERLARERADEFETALDQIGKIASFRLADTVVG